MYLWKSLAGLSAVALLAGPALAGSKEACCGETITTGSTVSRAEVRNESFNGSATLVGNPCAPAGPCADAGPCEAKCETECDMKVCKIDADIEKLRVINPECSTDLCIQYQVDVECQDEPALDLLVQIKCRDQIVFERLIPLENGRIGNETGEFLYTGTFQDSLPQVYRTSRLRAEGNVVRRGTTVSLDRERERVIKDASRPHGWAQPFYTAGNVLYTPVQWVVAR